MVGTTLSGTTDCTVPSGTTDCGPSGTKGCTEPSSDAVCEPAAGSVGNTGRDCTFAGCTGWISCADCPAPAVAAQTSAVPVERRLRDQNVAAADLRKLKFSAWSCGDGVPPSARCTNEPAVHA